MDDLTREDLVEKLKNEDFKVRQYIENIIKAGLTMGNKQLNKQMKNKSILIFQGSNLGIFKFNKNFGIKEEVNIEPLRPLSHNKKPQEKNKENKEKINKEKKEKEKKTEEVKKELIYDNRYLFAKRRQSIRYVLRKEVEEILKGGIFLQQKAIEEEEKTEETQNRFMPPKRPKFIKKKKDRGKLFRKSIFLKDIKDHNITPIKESSSSSTSEIKEESNKNNKSFEEKMQNFIDRIKKFKKGDEINMNEIDELISQRFKRDEKEKEKEIRIKGFLHKLNEYRDMNNKKRKKHNNFSYKEPINIMTNSGKDLNII